MYPAGPQTPRDEVSSARLIISDLILVVLSTFSKSNNAALTKVVHFSLPVCLSVKFISSH